MVRLRTIPPPIIAAHSSSVIEAGPWLRFDVEGLRVMLFPDGRALIDVTDDTDRAQAVYDRYVVS